MGSRSARVLCLALLGMFVCAAVAEAGVGRRCGKGKRYVVTYEVECRTVSGKLCYGQGDSCAQATINAKKTCNEPTTICRCYEVIQRRGCFGRCRTTRRCVQNTSCCEPVEAAPEEMEPTPASPNDDVAE